VESQLLSPRVDRRLLLNLKRPPYREKGGEGENVGGGKIRSGTQGEDESATGTRRGTRGTERLTREANQGKGSQTMKHPDTR